MSFQITTLGKYLFARQKWTPIFSFDIKLALNFYTDQGIMLRKGSINRDILLNINCK